jgi:S1-C subfamily serine protease
MSPHRSLILIALVSLLSTSAYAITGWVDVAAMLEKSVVPLTGRFGEGYGCSGFVINESKNFVLTDSHCQKDIVYVDKIPAEVVAVDVQQDLMVLEVEDLDRPALKMADSKPRRGQQIATDGYGMVLLKSLFRTAHVSAVDTPITDIQGGPFVVTDAAFVGGQSGGPGVNEAGEVVMIVQRASGLVGVGVNVEIIKDRMGKWIEKPRTP